MLNAYCLINEQAGSELWKTASSYFLIIKQKTSYLCSIMYCQAYFLNIIPLTFL
jgi:hypothetical protein